MCCFQCPWSFYRHYISVRSVTLETAPSAWQNTNGSAVVALQEIFLSRCALHFKVINQVQTTSANTTFKPTGLTHGNVCPHPGAIHLKGCTTIKTLK